MSNLIVTIDGPSASGKSTVSRKAAELLGFVYVDSGSFYRGLTWKVIRESVLSRDVSAVLDIMRKMKMEFILQSGAVRFTIDGIDPAAELRAQSIDDNVSFVSTIPEVRQSMVKWQRSLTRFGSLVMEGRDIGTVVFPKAQFKFYLDADPVERARRRCRESNREQNKGELDAVMQSISRRDAIDKGRATAPLKVPPGAHVLDTTSMSIDDVVAAITDTVSKGGLL